MRLVIFSFSLSFRDVEEMLAMRGVSLSYETVREWCLKFGQTYANSLRRRSPRSGDQWHLDEVFLKINGRLHYLWRAVDQIEGVCDETVQVSRSRAALPLSLRNHCLTFPSGQTSVPSQRLSRGDGVANRPLGSGDWRLGPFSNQKQLLVNL